LSNLFTFKFDGQNPDGTLSGSFEASGIRPRFLLRLENYGLASAFMRAVGPKGAEE
jgi:pilus assembly protein CpaF